MFSIKRSRRESFFGGLMLTVYQKCAACLETERAGRKCMLWLTFLGAEGLRL